MDHKTHGSDYITVFESWIKNKWGGKCHFAFHLLLKAGVLKHFGARDPFQGKKISKDPPHIYNRYWAQS